MRLVYIILAHKNPRQLVRLVSKVIAKQVSIYLHMDSKMSEDAFRYVVHALKDYPNIVFLRRKSCHWGDFSLVQTTLDAISSVLHGNHDFDYAILLSGQDYPIKSNREIHAFLESGSGKSFMEHVKFPYPYWAEGGYPRIEQWHFRLFRRTPSSRLQGRVLSRLGFYLLPHLPKRHFPLGYHPYGGSQWWCLSKDCLEYIHNFARHNESFVRFFKYVHIPDEIFFHTVVMNSPLRETIANDNLRYTEWIDGSSGPSTLCELDLERLVTTNKLFARKFDGEVDAYVLDQIDEQLEHQAIL